MQNRIIMNTASLQENFPEVYQKFFFQCAIVTSTCLVFDWGAFHSWLAGGPSLFQKLPLKIYVGLEPIQQNNIIEKGEILVFDPTKKKFKDPESMMLDWNVMLKELPELIFKETGKKEFPGFNLHILCELPKEHGFTFHSVSLNVAVLILLHLNQVSVEEVKQIVGSNSVKIQAKQEPVGKLFDKVIRFGWKINVLGGWRLSSANSHRAALMESNYPIISFTERRDDYLNKQMDDAAPFDLSESLGFIDKINYWVFRMEELFNLNPKDFFPLDIAFIYPGFGRLTEDSYSYTQYRLMPSFQDLARFAKDTFQPYFKESKKHLPDFAYDYENITENKYWLRFLQVQSLLNLKLLKIFKELYEQRMSQGAVKEFMNVNLHIARVRDMFTEDHSKNMQAVRHAITDRARATAGGGVEHVVRYNNYGQLDGALMVISAFQKFRRALQEEVDNLQQTYNQDICLDYASWIDGFCADGLIVEQFNEKNIFSKYIDSNSLQYCFWDEKAGLKKHLAHDQNIDKRAIDLLLDKINHKIYIRGEEFDSSAIPSQKATIEILEFLLERVKQLIPNKQLPHSGYADYRNELQGKIVSPLNKLLKEKIGKELGLKISGKLRNFFVEFKPKGLKIGIIDKIENK